MPYPLTVLSRHSNLGSEIELDSISEQRLLCAVDHTEFKLERKVEEGRRKFLAFVYPLLVKLLRVKS